MSDQKTLKDLHSATSSRESGDGVEPYNSRDGVQTDLFGQEVHLVSHSRQQESSQEKTTSDTCGLRSSISSESAALQQSLASRLQAQLDLDGLTIYKGTWKQKATPQQRLYYQAVLSQPRTKGTGSSSWPTPRVADTNNMNNSQKVVQERVENGRATAVEIITHNKITWAAQSAWPTPATRDYRDTGDLDKSRYRKDGKERLDTVPRIAFGVEKPSTAETENTAPSQLNPRFSLWLMGYPIEWAYCAERVTPLSRKRQRKS